MFYLIYSFYSCNVTIQINFYIIYRYLNRVQVFGNIKLGTVENSITRHNNFQSFIQGVMLLFRYVNFSSLHRVNIKILFKQSFDSIIKIINRYMHICIHYKHSYFSILNTSNLKTIIVFVLYESFIDYIPINRN